MWDGGVRYLDGRQKPPWVVAKVEWHPGELCPRVGFIVANLARAERMTIELPAGISNCRPPSPVCIRSSRLAPR